MPGRNETEMRRAAAFVEDGTLELAVDAMVMIHQGTLGPFGQSPGTPVLTGQHKSAGRVSVGSPSSHVPADDPPFASMSESEATSALSTARLGDSLFWASNAPVPELLEDGLSAKAPDGFLQLSVDESKRRTEATEIR